MKIKKLFFLTLFIFICITSLFVNIYITRSKNAPLPDIFDIDGIYFDLSLIEYKERAKQIENFINSKNIIYFSNVISQKENPIGQFYALCGFLNTNQKKAAKHLEKLLLSKEKVNIHLGNNTILTDYPVGYAYLKLIKEFPGKIVSKPEADFYSNIQYILLKAYKSKIAEGNIDYKRVVLSLISEKDPEILGDIMNDYLAGKPVEEMSQDEKIELSFLIYSLNVNERKEVIKKFLKENNEKILTNTLNAINENDSKEVAEDISKLLNNNGSPEVLKLAIEKYGSLLKKDSLEKIVNVMKESDNAKVIKASLEQIYKYGDDSNYEVLKLFLALKYPKEINLLALDTIVQTTYKTKPDDVLNTMAFLLRKGKEPLAQAAVKFFIEKNLYQNTGLVLYRLKQRESNEMDKLALEYIDFFKLKAGASLLRDLAKSNDSEISEKAIRLMKKLDISEVPGEDEEIEGESIIEQ